MELVRMSGLTLSQLIDLLTKQPSVELEGIALEFLDAFRDLEPLQEHDLTRWMVDGSMIRHPREIFCAVHQAIAEKWVEDAPQGLRLTPRGLAKRKATKTSIANTPNEGATNEVA